MALQARNLTPALSAAAAICDHMRDWLLGTQEGDWVSMGVISDGSYNVPEALYFSFPVICQDGKWRIVQVGSTAIKFVTMQEEVPFTSSIMRAFGPLE